MQLKIPLLRGVRGVLLPVKTIILLFLLIPQIIFSKEINCLKKDSLYFFTTNLLFVPTESGIFESRVGATKFIDKKNLKLDIGVSFDLAGYKVKDNTF